LSSFLLFLCSHITNESNTPDTCIFETNTIILNAKIKFGELYNGAWVSIKTGENWTNYTVHNNTPTDFYFVINSSMLVGEQTVHYQFYAQDNYNFTYNGSVKSFYVIKRTELIISPSVPDGMNGWYVTEPTFTLIKDSNLTGPTYYEWDSTGPDIYSEPFGLEGIPNIPPNDSAGTLKLKWWSNLSGCVEELQNQTFYVDLKDPEFKHLTPQPDTTIYNTLKPLISAYIDDVYESNSGINKTSIIMKLDNMTIVPALTEVGELDINTSYHPSVNLTLDEHHVFIYAEDNAGRNSSTSWRFYVSETPAFTFRVHSPENTIYNTRRIIFNMTTTEEVETMKYTDWNDNRPRERRLCRDCEEYYNRKSFRDGHQNLTFIATDYFGVVRRISRNFFIDSRDPRLYTPEPRRGFANGTFTVKFREENPKELFLNYGNGTDNRSAEVNLTACIEERNRRECEITVNLEEFDEQEIIYWFNMTDIAENYDESRKTDLKVDYTNPKINNVTWTTDRRRVTFYINITEPNFDEVVYTENGRERRMCSRLDEGICEDRKTFGDGDHNITIIVRDEAGNENSTKASFFIDSRKPRIYDTEPGRGFATGSFKAEFREENPEELWLIYGNETDKKSKELNLSRCWQDRTRTICEEFVNLTEFDEQEITYWFNITDIVGNYDESRETEIFVDFTKPILNYFNFTTNRRRVTFRFNVTEPNFDEINYYDHTDGDRAKWRLLCSRLRNGYCDKIKTFRKGSHNLSIEIVDKAGNRIQIDDVIFSV
jgi:hypothetical protein